MGRDSVIFENTKPYSKKLIFLLIFVLGLFALAFYYYFSQFLADMREATEDGAPMRPVAELRRELPEEFLQTDVTARMLQDSETDSVAREGDSQTEIETLQPEADVPQEGELQDLPTDSVTTDEGSQESSPSSDDAEVLVPDDGQEIAQTDPETGDDTDQTPDPSPEDEQASTESSGVSAIRIGSITRVERDTADREPIDLRADIVDVAVDSGIALASDQSDLWRLHIDETTTITISGQVIAITDLAVDDIVEVNGLVFPGEREVLVRSMEVVGVREDPFMGVGI